MGAILSLAAVAMLGLLLAPRSSAYDPLTAGQPAPEFELQSLDGDIVRLSDLKGKPVIINFWASWCQPCLREMPDFQAVYDRYKEDGLLVYGINVGESQVAVADYQKRVGVDFPLLLDVDDQAQAAYRILPLPATFFIHRDGTIRSVYQFQMSRAQIEAEAAALLVP